MRTWQMIEELTEHPKKKFKRKADGLIMYILRDCNGRPCLKWESGNPPIGIGDELFNYCPECGQAIKW